MKRPNIIVLFSDQQRWDTLGCYGQPLLVSPNLDRLAKEGVKFENAFTCQPVCGPARSCLQSGKYATQVNCHRNALALPQDIKTLADYFHESGYETAYVGKWHLPQTEAAIRRHSMRKTTRPGRFLRNAGAGIGIIGWRPMFWRRPPMDTMDMCLTEKGKNVSLSVTARIPLIIMRFITSTSMMGRNHFFCLFLKSSLTIRTITAGLRRRMARERSYRL